MQVAALIPVSLHAASADSEPGRGGGNSSVLSELAGEPLLGRVCTRLAQVARLGNLTVVEARTLKDLHLKLRLRSGKREFDAIGFGIAGRARVAVAMVVAVASAFALVRR